MIKPMKGKAFDKLPAKTLDGFEDREYLVSTKYDGNLIFIDKEGDNVRFFTSDWKQFNIELLRKDLANLKSDFILVGEFMHNSRGKLGDRRKSAILTTYRTNFAKGIANSISDEIQANIKVFDLIDVAKPYMERLIKAERVLGHILGMKVITPSLMTGSQARLYAKGLAREGWEGAVLVEPHSYYQIGKRVNHVIKLKNRPTADLKCIATTEGTGKYRNKIGALVLEDFLGRVVAVGSGLSDYDREKPEDTYVGKIIEIEYEHIADTYIQPIFNCIREDKHISD